ncbi:Uncharacterized protein TCM_040957 [Theobroma cacao]|uniref:Uncharacterized protein n=1 Tax=Theobroma cacao TaxID=3641 RepID=A0A061GZF4_THECC|nr:Uncharacterized protein TCM_040957 [Theobroma cacao]
MTSSIWLSIISLLVHYDRDSQVTKVGFGLLVGNGQKISFWHDQWIEGIILKFSFPRTHALATNKNGTVDKYGVWEGDEWQWCLELRRNMFDWELDQCEALHNILKDEALDVNLDDKLTWRDPPSGYYSTSSYRSLQGPAIQAWWAYAKWPYSNLSIQDLVRFPKSAMVPSKPLKGKLDVKWQAPLDGALKFNIGSALSGNPGEAGIGGVLKDVMIMHFKSMIDGCEIVKIPRSAHEIADSLAKSGLLVFDWGFSFLLRSWVNALLWLPWWLSWGPKEGSLNCTGVIIPLLFDMQWLEVIFEVYGGILFFCSPLADFVFEQGVFVLSFDRIISVWLIKVLLTSFCSMGDVHADFLGKAGVV